MGRKCQQELCLILAPRVGIEVIRPWFQPVIQQMLSNEGASQARGVGVSPEPDKPQPPSLPSLFRPTRCLPGVYPLVNSNRDRLLGGSLLGFLRPCLLGGL